jgi:hypothetical protein
MVWMVLVSYICKQIVSVGRLREGGGGTRPWGHRGRDRKMAGDIGVWYCSYPLKRLSREMEMDLIDPNEMNLS